MSNDDTAWPLVVLRDVTVDVPNFDPVKEKAFTYVDISSIDNARCEIVNPKHIAGIHAPSRAKRPLAEGDVLFSNVRTYLRNVAQVKGLPAPALASTGFTLLRPTKKLDSRYLYHLVRSDFFISRVTPEQTGTQYPATSDRVVRSQLIPLPEVAIQEMLADTIDEIEASRVSATKHLVLAKQSVDRFRQTVLAAACSGRLTADWRESNETEQLTELPKSWQKSPFADVIEDSFYGPRFSSDSYKSDGVPTIRTTDMDQHGNIVFRDPPKLKLDAASLDRFRLRDGDLLVTRTGSIGKCAVYVEGLGPALPSAYLIRFRLRTDRVVPSYALLYLLSPRGQQALLGGSTATTQPNVNARAVASIVLPLPPIVEQREILRRAKRLLALADEISERVEEAAKRVERSSQAVLAKAFRGDLTPMRNGKV